VEGLVRDATGVYKKLAGEDLIDELFNRQSFQATQHRILAQRFDISVVSEIQVEDVSFENQKWFDSFYFTFEDESKDKQQQQRPPIIKEVFFSFHN
jgi:hypothetical protein